MVDYSGISQLLIKRGKVRGKPVAVSLFKSFIPDSYEPIQDTPCSIIHHAMDDEKRVYFDAEHHDCLVGVHHAGIVPGRKVIVTGEYLSETSDFFTYEGAARLKGMSPSLPPGYVKAIGAAPLDHVPEGVGVDWVVVVCNPHNANGIAASRFCREGIPPYAEIGTSLCGALFATPWYRKNIVVTFGDFGGRMHNRIKQDQLFVIIPTEFLYHLPAVLNHMRVDVKASREMTKPAHSDFLKKAAPKSTVGETEQEKETQEPTSISFTMEWDNEAKQMMQKVPEAIAEMAVAQAEEFARDKGYHRVTRRSIEELMESLGMNLDEML